MDDARQEALYAGRTWAHANARPMPDDGLFDAWLAALDEATAGGVERVAAAALDGLFTNLTPDQRTWLIAYAVNRWSAPDADTLQNIGPRCPRCGGPAEVRGGLRACPACNTVTEIGGDRTTIRQPRHGAQP